MIKTYKFGLRPPISREEEVRHQLQLAYQYQVDLLKIKRETRDARRILEQGPEIATLENRLKEAEDQLDVLTARLAKQRASTRSRSESADLRNAVKEARKCKKAAKQALTSKRKEIRDTKASAKDEIADRWVEQRRNKRGEFGTNGKRLYYGTYILIEASVDQADSDTPLWDGLVPIDPRFPKSPREGRIGAQIQHGITTKELYACRDTRVQLRREPDLFQERVVCVDGKGKGGGKHRPQFGTLRLRVGSDERKPVWAEWPIKMHRPIPEHARIKYVTVRCYRTGPREYWEALFSVDIGDAKVEKCGIGTVAIDIGWRVMGDELRVAAWVDNYGNRGEVRLDARTLSALNYFDKLRGIRDNNLNALKAEFLTELPDEIPEWLRRLTVKKQEAIPSSKQARHYLSQWKSFGRWAWLAKHWEDGDCPATLKKWCYHDHHLWEWETAQRRKSLGRRKDQYRCFAAWLARTYSCVVLEDFNLKHVTKTADPEATAENKTAEKNRQKASLHELRDAIKNAVVSRGGTVELEDPRYTTQECSACGFVEKWDAAASVVRKPACPQCGAVWDQDYSAAEILLRRWRERSGDDEISGGARDEENVKNTETKWQRVQRQLKEKQARREGAREAQDNQTEVLSI